MKSPYNANRTFFQYKEMEKYNPDSGMLREVKWQYADMAKGGDGGILGFEEEGQTTCRGINYPDCPDEFFQEVCALMGWPW
jgi:hypothetical protein